MQRIGILGGMMDPIHAGHLSAALSALNAGLDRVLLCPCQAPPHRPAPQTQGAQRLEMCRLAAQADPRLEACDAELRHGPCYAVDTVRLLQTRYFGARFTWILGADKLSRLSQWHKAAELFNLCDFYVCPRPGADTLQPVPGARLRALQSPTLDISSRAVIRRLHAFDDAPDMLPRAVARYIAKNSLYQPDFVPILRRYGMQDKRLEHTLGVRATAVRLAEVHGASMQAAAAAAMLHDIAKPLPLADMQALAHRYGIKASAETLADVNLLHGPVAAAIAERELGITHAGVLSAVACHTTGKPGMSVLDKVLFIADAIEPHRRPYPGLTDMRSLAETDLNAAVLLSMQRTREYVISRGLHFCKETQLAMQDLSR